MYTSNSVFFFSEKVTKRHKVKSKSKLETQVDSPEWGLMYCDVYGLCIQCTKKPNSISINPHMHKMRPQGPDHYIFGNQF